MSDNKDNESTKYSLLRQCPDCNKDVKPEDQALACEICAKWYHISCQGMGKTVYAFFDEED